MKKRKEYCDEKTSLVVDARIAFVPIVDRFVQALVILDIRGVKALLNRTWVESIGSSIHRRPIRQMHGSLPLLQLLVEISPVATRRLGSGASRVVRRTLVNITIVSVLRLCLASESTISYVSAC